MAIFTKKAGEKKFQSIDNPKRWCIGGQPTFLHVPPEIESLGVPKKAFVLETQSIICVCGNTHDAYITSTMINHKNLCVSECNDSFLWFLHTKEQNDITTSSNRT